MQNSVWASDDPVEPANAARSAASNSRSSSQHTRDIYQDPSTFARPQRQAVRMATADPNPGPALHNPAMAAQMGGLNRSMTQATSKNAPRLRAAPPLSNQPSQLLSRPDSATGFKPAPPTNTTSARGSHKPAPSRPSQAPPTITVEQPTWISSSTTHKVEDHRPTARDPSLDGEQWRSQKDNKFAPFMNHVHTYDRKGRPYSAGDEDTSLEHAGTGNSSSFNDGDKEYTDRDAAHDSRPSLSYDDYAEPKVPAAPVRATAPSSDAIKADQREVLKALEKQMKQQEQDAKPAREIEEREAREHAARVTEEQEKAERAAELNRQRSEVQGPIAPSTPLATSTTPQSDITARLDAALDSVLKLTEDQARTERLVKECREKLIQDARKIHDGMQLVGLLRGQQKIEAQLDSAK